MLRTFCTTRSELLREARRFCFSLATCHMPLATFDMFGSGPRPRQVIVEIGRTFAAFPKDLLRKGNPVYN